MLPDNITYGKVVGRVLMVVPDGPDADRDPDGVAPPLGSKVTFTPPASVFINATSDPPSHIYLSPKAARFAPDGTLVDNQGNPGIWLVATDSPALDPSGWLYQVTIRIPGRPAHTFTLAVPTDATVDMSSVTAS